jgi:uncharacterized SAM-binding protein YcdF (DUF218 family)
MLRIDSGFLRVILILISIFFILEFWLPTTVGIINIGNVFGLGCSIVLLVFAAFNKRVSALLDKIYACRAGKITLRVLGILIVLGAIYCLILSILMLHSAYRKPKSTPQAVIILGCKVRGTNPTRMLSERIKAAYNAMQEYPEMIAVVSGGKGNDEDISEAECMRRELMKKGIAESRILIEDQSTSTSENLRFSHSILEENGITGNIMIATDGYHEMRAQYLAKRENLPDCDPAPAHTTLLMFPTYWVREWFGLTHAFIFGD